MNATVERRYLLKAEYPDAIGVEERDGQPPVLVGISPPWDSMSVDLGGFREKFAPTAFDGLVDRSPNDPRGQIDVPFLQDHLSHLISGRTTNGRLTITKELKGLGYRHTPIDTQHGTDLVKLVRDKTITGSSFAFTTADGGDTWTEDERGNIVRTVFRASGLYDISAVTYPAYPKSSVAIGSRSLEQWREARGLVAHRGEGGKRLTIAIDYDAAFVAAPGLWRSLCEDATRRGDEVLLVSASQERDQIEAYARRFVDGMNVRVECVSGFSSRKHALSARGITVDAWVMGGDGDGGAPPVKVSTLLGARAAAAASLARMRLALGK
jgi:hypothetical protein